MNTRYPRRASKAPANESELTAEGIIVEKSTGYTFKLIDVENVEGGGDESWQFRVLTDSPPSVVIDQPASDLFVTERAVVDFRVRARDDLALRQVVLVLSRSDAKGLKEKTISLFNGPDKPPLSSFSAFDAGATGEPIRKDCTVDLPAFPNSSFPPACK